jgi:hypothetical protein
MRPLSGRHAVDGFKITTLGRGGFASRVSGRRVSGPLYGGYREYGATGYRRLVAGAERAARRPLLQPPAWPGSMCGVHVSRLRRPQRRQPPALKLTSGFRWG